MTSSATIFVWAWLPGHVHPVVAARLDQVGEFFELTYGQSYLSNPEAIALGPELPLGNGPIAPKPGLWVPGCIRDGAPDGWGQRVILHRRRGKADALDFVDDLSLHQLLLESGSNRIGALDFQRSPTEYVPRTSDSTVGELLCAAERLMSGERFTPEIDQALIHGSSVGGARPKALVRGDDGREYIAKFSSSSDPYPVVKAEAAAMLLAASAGVATAPVSIISTLGKDVLLVERFDRTGVGARRHVISLLTLLELDEMFARYATYPDFADLIVQAFTDPTETLRQLFRRIVVNIAVGNTDDHARNHAALWDGTSLSLSAAYDICPQLRSGGYTEQAMAIDRSGAKASTFRTCIDAASVYGLDTASATDVVREVVDQVRAQWGDVAEQVGLNQLERDAMWERQILNPFAFEEL